jgi:Zn-dependent M28 family amino/carboxypeptidase
MIIRYCMPRTALLALGFCLIAQGSDWRNRADRLTRAEMQSVIEFLSDDLLEGRAPGERGGRLAEIYVRSLYKFMGLPPASGSDNLQSFPLKGFTTKSLRLQVVDQELKHQEDVVGGCPRQEDTFALEGEAVFVGFGIRTPLWNWDDFKGTDLRDKVLLVRVNDPGHFVPTLFEGQSMTYFGRWRYKIEEAARLGAKAILLIHTDDTAGYGWNIVSNSWAKENLYLPASLENNLQFRGWIREESLKRLLALKGMPLEDLYAKSLNKDFHPIPLGWNVKISGQNSFRTLSTSNVIAEIPGKSAHRIVLSAHIDHLGKKESLAGDSIFNGAIDNGSAVAALLLTAKILKDLEKELPYTMTFLACQAEEAGLLGATYYVKQTDRSELVANINFESTPVWEKSGSLMGVGARFSTLEDMLREIAGEEKLQYADFSLSNQGFFYRSDQFPFAQNGIPAIWISAGEDFTSGKNHLKDYFVGGDYHTVKDEYHADWELESLRQTVRLALALIEKIGASKEPPRWKTRLTFPLEPN